MDQTLIDELLPRVKPSAILSVALGALGVLLGIGILSLVPLGIADLIGGETEFNADLGAGLCFGLFGGLIFLLPSAYAVRMGLRPARRHPVILALQNAPTSITRIVTLDMVRRGHSTPYLKLESQGKSLGTILCDSPDQRAALHRRLAAALPHLSA